MLKKIFIILSLLFSSFVYSQIESQQYIHKYLVRVDGSIVPGFMFKDNLSNVYLNGNGEYYLDNKVSMRGDINYMVGSTGLSNDSIGLKNNHSIMVGPVFHFHTNGHFDPYFIIQPGIAYTSSFRQTYMGNVINDANKITTSYKGVLSPLGSLGFGFNYYFQRFAHLFFETRYFYGNHLSDAPSTISLQELRVTFGLGFNLFVHKDKQKPA